MLSIARRQALLSTVSLACPAIASAQSAKLLHVVVPYPAGGLVDLQARIVAAPMGRALGQTTVVDNIAGAAGAIGLLRIATASADAPEIGIGTDSDAVLAPLVNSDLRYRSGQFRLLGLLSTAPMVLLADARVLPDSTQGLHDVQQRCRHRQGWTPPQQMARQRALRRIQLDAIESRIAGVFGGAAVVLPHDVHIRLN